MSTNWLLIFMFTLVTVLGIFLPNIIVDADTFPIEATLPSSPSVWDILTFNASFVWDCMTFSITGVPWWLGVIFWAITFIWIYCAFRLVRGTS